jgi:hypothetical protein
MVPADPPTPFKLGIPLVTKDERMLESGSVDTIW